jgi:hypothetical protein
VIVEPDFLDHWKTRELIRITGDPSSPLVVLRLWSHCHYRKTSRFMNLPDTALASICRWEKSPQELRAVLLEVGFLEQRGDQTIVHDWDVSNRMLISAWNNGAKGGRPKKKITSRLAAGKPTHLSNLSNLSYLSVLKEEGVRGRFKEWIEVRKAMGKKPKDWDKMFAEQCKWLSQFSAADQMESLSASIRNNWQGLQAPKQGSNGQKPFTRPETGGAASPAHWTSPEPPSDEEREKSKLAMRETIGKLKTQMKMK